MSFAYLRPATLAEAVHLLSSAGGNARLLAGGTDLLVRIRLGHIQPATVIDLKHVAELRADITEHDDVLRVGARVVMTDLIADPRVVRHFLGLADAARVVGSVQIRNRATLAGNICNASPAADTAPALLVYRARVNLVGPDGRRTVPIEDFFTGPGRTVMGVGELVESIDLPVPTVTTGAAFGRITRRRGVDLATVNMCALVTAGGEARFAYGAVGPRPFVVYDETGVLGEPTSDKDARQKAIEKLIAHATPRSDVRGSREYRLAMLDVMTRRSLDAAHARLSASSASAGVPQPEGWGLHRLMEPPTFRLGETTTFRATGPIINAAPHPLNVPPHHTLLDALRDHARLTGTKECCAEGECGACTVLLNGRAVCSCLVLAAEMDADEIVTIEGLGAPGKLDALQDAFVRTGAVQCGFCIPGMIVAAKALLLANPHPTVAEIQAGLEGNLCRCGGYHRIIRAVAEAAEGTR